MTMALERTAVRVELLIDRRWFAVCDLADLTPGRGVAALLPDGAQVAVFLDRAGRAYAIDNRDPFTGAYVLSRGLLGSAGGRPFVASPLLKQRFDLETGRCLDDDGVAVQAYLTRTTGGPVEALGPGLGADLDADLDAALGVVSAQVA
ncbi:nitrite reductase small subunit NirD [Streptomyces sparsogenes]|uniref:Nitrite reductase (NAD(P)H) small subunit n=1 Tax=Streptomyces sparsogenes DSM 40356 TaxID=1331668 RepID=A0A1R1SIM8_9ACTN|nr:nitrite reductase small subunit NirD [Streptomyces sparsogenes]OMI38161.1 nitrite reductase (NAD(P)H) small subunit [Streptomyces sparsogenes DSM 40356]